MTQDEVRALFAYEPEAGMLRRVLGGKKEYPWRKIGRDGRYLAFSHANRTYYLHRLVWLYHTGEVPPMIDHIDGDTRNNRIENLRVCSPSQNQYNSKRKAHNRAGYKGVVFHPKCQRKPWQAKIAKAGRVHSLGYYATPEEAAEAYAKGAALHAGEFARLN